MNVKKIVRVACALSVLGITPAHAIEHIKNYVPEAQKVGHGRLTYLFWDVYDATLFAPQGDFANSKPFALQLSYLRDIEGKKIADRSAEEMRTQGITDEVKLAAWHSQMREIFPDVAEGSSLPGHDGTCCCPWPSPAALSPTPWSRAPPRGRC